MIAIVGDRNPDYKTHRLTDLTFAGLEVLRRHPLRAAGPLDGDLAPPPARRPRRRLPPARTGAVNPFGHVDLRVSELDAAFPFYDALLPALGFTERYPGERWKVWARTEPLPSTAYFGITESPGHVPNDRIAFWVAGGGEVDRIAEVARDAGAAELSGPKPMPYGPGYYAVFFADPCGNRLEVYVRPA